MGIKPKVKKTDILQEGSYDGILAKVEYKPSAENPKRVVLNFQPDGTDFLVPKELAASLAVDSPLRRDLESLKNTIRELAGIVDQVKQAEKEKRTTDREIDGIRSKLRSIQNVSI